jgi:hypothetical protein
VSDGKTIGHLLVEAAERWPDRTAVAFPKGARRYAELATAARRLARGLLEGGTDGHGYPCHGAMIGLNTGLARGGGTQQGTEKHRRGTDARAEVSAGEPTSAPRGGLRVV